MIQTSIKGAAKLRGLGQGSDDLFSRVRMGKLAEFARDTVVARIRTGRGSDDAAMAPLSRKTSAVRNAGKVVRIRSGYAEAKARRGLQPIRDWWGTGKDGGHMLDNLTVRQATPNSARIAITSKKQRDKAIANERRSPALSFSPADVEKITARAVEMFRAEVRASVSDFKKLVRKLKGRRAA